MLYRVALALGLFVLGAYIGRELSRPRVVTAVRKPRRRLPHHLMNAPMDNVSVH